MILRFKYSFQIQPRGVGFRQRQEKHWVTICEQTLYCAIRRLGVLMCLAGIVLVIGGCR